MITSDGGGLLLGLTDRAIGLIKRSAQCFTDHRDPELIENEVRTLVSHRVLGLAMGYEDGNEHAHLRHDPPLAVLLGKLAAKSDCADCGEEHAQSSRTEPAGADKVLQDQPWRRAVET